MDPRAIHSGPHLKAHSQAGSKGARAHVYLLDLSRLNSRDLKTNQDLTWCCSSREVKCQLKYAVKRCSMWCFGRLWMKNVCNEDLGLLHALACSVGKCQESRLPSIWKTTSCLMISFKRFITRGVRAQQTLLGQSQHTWLLYQDRPARPLPPFNSLSAHLPLAQVRIGFSAPQELRGDRRE